jgi:hypothetical protein
MVVLKTNIMSNGKANPETIELNETYLVVKSVIRKMPNAIKVG